MAIIKEVGDRGKLHIETSSPQELFRVIDKLGWTPQRGKASDFLGTDAGFYTFESLGEAMDVFRNTPEKVSLFDPNDSRLESPYVAGKGVEFDVTGDYVDVGRYLAGEPEDFGYVTQGNPAGAFCTINILNSFVCTTDPSIIEARAKRVLRLVDWLEQQNIRTQIVTAGDNGCAYMSVIIKRFQDPFDINTLSITQHPDWLRRILFLVKEQSKTWEPGYGNAETYDLRMQRYEPRPEDGLYIYVGGWLAYNNDHDYMERQFDKVEQQLTEVVAQGLTWSEERMMVV